MSDNAETREAFHCDDCGSDTHDTLVCKPHPVLAALPPVAGPEVRPDETLRALSEAATPGPWRWTDSEVVHDLFESGMAVVGTEGDPVACVLDEWYENDPGEPAPLDDAAFIVAAVNHVRALMAAPAPAPGDEGLRARVEAATSERWPFGDVSAALLIARAAWPHDTQVTAWAPRMLTDRDLFDRTRAEAEARLFSAFAHIRTALASPAPAATEVGEGER